MSKILLVEDNDMNREMMSRWLVRWGYIVMIAVDGEAAVIAARADKPDLILMDLGLPKINGWEATRQIRAAEETRTIPIIALTGYAVEDDRSKALAAGCDEYCPKPVNLQWLQDTIRELLHNAGESVVH